MTQHVRLPTDAVVVLVGPSGSGKSAWAAAEFRNEQVVSTDGLRALVGEGPDDQRAGQDAFDVLDLVLERRLRRGLLTVVDSLALDSERRRSYVALARRYRRPCHVVAFDTPARECRARNKQRRRPVPAKVLSAQLKAWAEVREHLEEDGFDAIHRPGPVAIVARALLHALDARQRQRQEPMTMRFGLQLSSFQWPGRPHETADRLAAIARSAEQVGFSSLWLMDHFVQVPQVGREWDDILESYTTLGFLAASTTHCRLGTLVTGVTYRNLAHLAKIVATLDVLSGGRAVCGLGAAWYEREHLAYGWRFPPAGERLDLLEDALRLLPLMWGKGTPGFDGGLFRVPEAICYPRPIQDRIPVLVGGGGERRTLRLVARYADACNLQGEPDRVQRKLGVLARHCDEVGRDLDEIEVTHLSPLVIAADRVELTTVVDALRGSSESPEASVERRLAGTVEDHVGRFRLLAEVGVRTAIVSLPLQDSRQLETFAAVISAFSEV